MMEFLSSQNLTAATKKLQNPAGAAGEFRTTLSLTLSQVLFLRFKWPGNTSLALQTVSYAL